MTIHPVAREAAKHNLGQKIESSEDLSAAYAARGETRPSFLLDSPSSFPSFFLSFFLSLTIFFCFFLSQYLFLFLSLSLSLSLSLQLFHSLSLFIYILLMVHALLKGPTVWTLFLSLPPGFARYPMVGYIYKVNSMSSDEIWLWPHTYARTHRKTFKGTGPWQLFNRSLRITASQSDSTVSINLWCHGFIYSTSMSTVL